MVPRIATTSRTNAAFFRVALFFAIVGALNWGLIGLFDWNLVDAIFGGGATETTSAASRVVYTLVGVAGLVSMLLLPRKLESTRNVRTDI